MWRSSSSSCSGGAACCCLCWLWWWRRLIRKAEFIFWVYIALDLGPDQLLFVMRQTQVDWMLLLWVREREGLCWVGGCVGEGVVMVNVQ